MEMKFSYSPEGSKVARSSRFLEISELWEPEPKNIIGNFR